MNTANLPDIDPRRAIPVEGAYNVRDLGGYETADGRQVRWRTLFRAADIHALSPSAQATLIDAGVRTVIDLRGSRELIEAASVFKDRSDVQYRPHNMTGDALINRWGTIPVPADSSIRLSTMYSTVLDERGEMIKTILESVSQPGTLPAVFHCTAGKDRTGVLAASPAEHRRRPTRPYRRGLRPQRKIPLRHVDSSPGRLRRERVSAVRGVPGHVVPARRHGTNPRSP